MPSLFRPEVIEGRQQAWLGSIQLVRPVPLAVLTLLVVTIAVLVGAFLFEGRYTRKAHITGYLVPDRGVKRLVPPQAGVVADSHVVEGQSVRQGDVLFVLSVDRATLTGDTQAAVQQSMAARRGSLQESRRHTAQIGQDEAAAMQRTIDAMRDELRKMDEEAEAVAKQYALRKQDVDQYEALMQGQNFVSPAALRTKQADMHEAEGKLRSLSVKRASHEREIAALHSKLREHPLRTQAALAVLDRELASLSEASAETEAKRTVVIRAPEDGVVTAVLAEKGASVSAGSALASLLPAGAQLRAELFAPSSAVGFVRPQQQVQLRYQAFPYQKFGHHAGQVLQVSRTPLQATDLAGLPLRESVKGAPQAEPLYRITVALDQQSVPAYGQAQPLVPGMQLEADVLLDRRRLIEWIFEPLLSVTGRV